jgi:hypothetical protein
MTSTLDPDNIPEPDRQLGKGHGTSALGPSGNSDSGSDVQSGGKRLSDPDAELGLDRGTNEDIDTAPRDPTAGPDIGDAWLDSDTDEVGTGEQQTVGRDTDIEAGADIDVDRVDYLDPADDPDNDMSDFFVPNIRHPNRTQHGRR